MCTRSLAAPQRKWIHLYSHQFHDLVSVAVNCSPGTCSIELRQALHTSVFAVTGQKGQGASGAALLPGWRALDTGRCSPAGPCHSCRRSCHDRQAANIPLAGLIQSMSACCSTADLKTKLPAAATSLDPYQHKLAGPCSPTFSMVGHCLQTVAGVTMLHVTSRHLCRVVMGALWWFRNFPAFRKSSQTTTCCSHSCCMKLSARLSVGGEVPSAP